MNRSLVLVLLVPLISIAACKKNEPPPVDPEEAAKEDLWLPDEDLEAGVAHEVDHPAVDPYAGMSEEQRMDEAKILYIEAEALAGAEKWSEAEGKYEQAYHLVPNKHGFAFKVADAAYKAGDCEKAKTYLDHFLQYAEKEKYEEQLKIAEEERAGLEC